MTGYDVGMTRSHFEDARPIGESAHPPTHPAKPLNPPLELRLWGLTFSAQTTQLMELRGHDSWDDPQEGLELVAQGYDGRGMTQGV